MSVLDYGCFDGSFGRELIRHKAVQYVGVDKNRDIVRLAPGTVDLRELTVPLPFEDGTFDVATMFEVLEHIHDQAKVLREVHRVLRPKGYLIVSVPRKNLFSFLDLGNMKFRMPKLHEFFYTLAHSPAAYKERYVDNPNGLVGDVEIEKRWHQHFEDRELVNLLARCGFSVEELDGAGLFQLPMTFVGTVFRLNRLFPPRIRNWDNYSFHDTGLFCAARRSS